MAVVHRVPGKQFVAAVTAESDGHMLSNKPGKQVGGDKRRIRERFVEPAADLAYEVPSGFGAEDLFVMICREMSGNLAGVFCLVKRIFGKTDRESFYGFGGVLRRKCSNRRRIDPAGKKHAQRNISNQPRSKRIRDQLAQVRRGSIQVRRMPVPRKGQVPVPAYLYIAVLNSQNVSSRQF